MSYQLMFEDITKNMGIPILVKETSSLLSAKWAAASGDFDPIHYDKEYAVGQKLPSTVVNGRFKAALLCQFMTAYGGPAGRLKRLAVRHQGMDLVGNNISCKGLVTRKYVERGECLIDCEIWIEDVQGKKTASGSATISLPSRSKKPTVQGN
jgi:hypothetical protein